MITIELFTKTNRFKQAEPHNGTSQADPFDPYPTVSASIVSASHTPQPQTNPYVQDPGSLGVAAFYQGSGNFSQPVCTSHWRNPDDWMIDPDNLRSFNIISTLRLVRTASLRSPTKDSREIFSFPKTFAKCFRKRLKLALRPFQVRIIPQVHFTY